MNRLLFIMPFTHDLEQMKKFYQETVGLQSTIDTPAFVQFRNDGEGGSLALLAIQPQQKREIELCFESTDIDADVATLRGRGLAFIDEVRQFEFGRVIHFRDPEGNLLSLLQPPRSPEVAPKDEGTEHGARAGGAPAAVAVRSPKLTKAIVNARDVAATKAFYRDCLGLNVQTDSPWWTEFFAGGSTLAIHPRVDDPTSEKHHATSLTIGFEAEDLITWADEARERGIHFTTAPSDEGFGEFADTTDPDGNELTFREPSTTPTIEEQLAEPYDDDEVPQHSAIRKSVKKGAKAVSRVAVKPEYKTDSAPKKKPGPGTAKAKAKVAHSTRGAGPAGTRLKPKRAADPKRARNRPAVGRLKKAERRTLSRKKVAVASASKNKPVKRAAATKAKGRAKLRSAGARGRAQGTGKR